MELAFRWIICWQVDAFADVDHQLNKNHYRQQNGPGGVVSAPWSLTSPVHTKFPQALWSCCLVHAMTCTWAARWELVTARVSRNSPAIAALGSVSNWIFVGGNCSWLQEVLEPDLSLVICVDYQSTTLLVLLNFHCLKCVSRCGRKDAETWGRVSAVSPSFPL